VYILGDTTFKEKTCEIIGRNSTDAWMPMEIPFPTSQKITQIATGCLHNLFLTGIFISFHMLLKRK